MDMQAHTHHNHHQQHTSKPLQQSAIQQAIVHGLPIVYMGINI